MLVLVVVNNTGTTDQRPKRKIMTKSGQNTLFGYYFRLLFVCFEVWIRSGLSQARKKRVTA